MPLPNFMWQDLTGAAKAIALFPAFLLFPGYVAAWALDLFGFRRRTFGFRAALALPLSIAICPILTYLAGRYAGMPAVWAGYALCGVAFAGLAARDRKRWHWCARRECLLVGGMLAAWLVVCVLSLVDLQIGDRLYYPTNTYDYSVRSAIGSAIRTTGVPPESPFFHPGHAVLLRYHYFWVMVCSLVNRLGGAGVTARQALIGGTFWCGLALFGLVALCLRLLLPATATGKRERLTAAALLLGITGLDIVPSLFFLFLYSRGQMSFVLPSGECWNEYVDWFLHSTLWAPHAVAALVAGFVAALMLWQAPGERGLRGKAAYAVTAGCALASAAGLNIWVAMVFAVFFALWTAVTLWKRWGAELLALGMAGAAAILLIRPYLHEIAGPATGGQMLVATVRAFSLTALVPVVPGMSQWMRLVLVNGTLLPLNYLLEFGLFFVVARLQWLKYRASGKPLSRTALAGMVMVISTTLICTFLRSGVIGNNDLGWRGFLPAQLVLLLWSVDLFAGRERIAFPTVALRQALVVCFVLGAAGSAYDLAITRFYPVMADRGVVPPLDWMSPDRAFGRRTFAARAAYEWVRGATPLTAAVQANPTVFTQDTLGFLYGDRPTVAADPGCLTTFGGEAAQCGPVLARVLAAFPVDAGAEAASLQDVCAALPIDTLVAKDTDPVWRNRKSWVWTERPDYANAYLRLFRCQSRNRTLTSWRKLDAR